MAKINILFVITKLELGGAQLQLLSLIRGLDRSKYNIFLFTAREGFLSRDAGSIPGITVRYSYFLERRINPFLDLAVLIELYLFMKRERISIVHTHSSKAGIVGRFSAFAAGVPRIFHTVHGWSFNRYQNAIVRNFYVLMERAAASVSTRLVVVSECDRSRGIDAGIGRGDNYVLIRYGIERGLFRSKDRSIREHFGIPRSAVLVGTIACFKPQKAFADLIAAARKVCAASENVFFIIAGDGSLRPSIESMIIENGLGSRVLLAGWRRDIPGFLSALDIFMLASRWEGLPVSVMEAMASGLPVVATDTGGISELVIDGKNGYLVPVGDTCAMADILLRLAGDGALRSEISSRSEIRGADWTARDMVIKTERLYS